MSLQKKNVAQVWASGGLIPPVLRSILRNLPMVAKWLVLLVFLVNARSWPLMWHIRVFRPVFYIRFQHRLILWRTMFSSKEVRDKRVDEWLDSITPIGENPFKRSVSQQLRATIDDCDFNGHLSNSSYAKTLDTARFQTALVLFPMFFRAGGWMALGGTHFHYLREIPMFAQYEVRSSLVAWDQKWLFVIHKFVSKSRGKKAKTKVSESSSAQNGATEKGAENIFHASLRTPADITASNAESPFAINTPVGRTNQETSAALKAVAAGLAAAGEPDGVTLHTVAVSEVCFKIGRITVPPALAIAVNGLSAPPSEFGSSLSAYSRTNPPPYWQRAKAIMSIPLGGSTKALRNLLKGGWRDVPESERWWDQALGGATEQQRKAGLEVIGVLRSGMDAARVTLALLG